MTWVLRNPSWFLGSRQLLYHESNHQTSQWFLFLLILCSPFYSRYNMNKVEDNRMHWYLLGNQCYNYVERYSIPLSDGLQITMFGRWYQFYTKFFFNKVFFEQMLSKSLVSLLLNAITTFRYKFQIQTSVLMSGAIREAISSCYFKIYQVLKKTSHGDFGVLGITRLLDFC